MEFRQLTKKEQAVCEDNVHQFQYMFKICVRKCSYCNYPLSALVEHFYSHETNGKVCDLCHTLEDAARQQPGLREAHDQWKADQVQKKKLTDGKNYF